MVLETCDQGNQYWLVCPDYIALFFVCFALFFGVSIIQQSESDTHTHTHTHTHTFLILFPYKQSESDTHTHTHILDSIPI